MKIISLRAENFKKILVVEIKPDGNIVQITGANDQGKSSVLDAIEAALGTLRNAPREPVRKGAESAKIKIDLGEYKVTRRFTEAGGSSLVVEAEDGARYPSPQKLMDKLVGAISFDPVGFMRLEPDAQFDVLRKMLNLEIDFEAIAKANQSDYDARTECNRRAKALRAQASAILVPEDAPDGLVNLQPLADELSEASQGNIEIVDRRQRRENAVGKIKEHRDQAAEILGGIAAALNDIEKRGKAKLNAFDAEIARLQFNRAALVGEIESDKKYAEDERKSQAASLEGQANDLQSRLDAAGPLPDPVDIEEIGRRLSEAEANNKKAGKRIERARIEADALAEETRAEDLTAAMDARKKAIVAAMASAKMPIEGLSLGDREVRFNGVPLAQASAAQKLKVSVAIAMAMNPQLRVLLIRDGSLLDEKSLATIAEMAKGKDYQLWIESVDSSGKVGIVMEEGHIKGVAHAAE